MIRFSTTLLRQHLRGRDVELVTSGDARRILHIGGRAINQRTFDKIVQAGILKSVAVLQPVGTRLFLRADCEALAKVMPKERQHSRYSIVEHLRRELEGRHGSGKKKGRP